MGRPILSPGKKTDWGEIPACYTVKSLSVQVRYSKNLKNAPHRKLMSVEHVRRNILIAVDTLSNTA